MIQRGVTAIAVAVSLLLAQDLAIAAGDKSDAKSRVKLDAIIGGDTDAIIGGDRRKTARHAPLIVVKSANVNSRALVVDGPIDWIDPVRNRIQILGQELSINTTHATLEGLAVRVSSGEMISAVVFGAADPDGKLTPRHLHISDQQFVLGVTPVAVVGKVQNLDRLTAKFDIGGLTVDYSGLLGGGYLSITEGGTVEVTGVKFSKSGGLTATSILTR